MNYDDFLLLPFSEERTISDLFSLPFFLSNQFFFFFFFALLHRLASDVVWDAGYEWGGEERAERRKFQFFLLRWIKKFIVAYWFSFDRHPMAICSLPPLCSLRATSWARRRLLHNFYVHMPKSSGLLAQYLFYS